MVPDDSRPRPSLPSTFLVFLLAVSVLTNLILLVRLNNPALWRRVQLAFVSAPKVAPTDHRRGSPTARVTIIEYSDFQCPYCARLHASLRQLVNETDINWVYRHFPLAEIHPVATRAAEACECAGEQGRFWEYADALFASPVKLSEDQLMASARTLGLDVAALGRCLESGKFSPVVAAQHEDGVTRKVMTTPTFFVNGERFEGALPFDELKRVVARRELSR